MRYHKIYMLADPRYPLEDPKHIRYIGRTSGKVSARLNSHLASWHKDGGPKWEWLHEMLQAGTKPNITVIEGRISSAREAKERELYWIHYYEGQGYELVNIQMRDHFMAWDRQRVIEDFHIEVMRLLLGQESPYSVALKKLLEKGEAGSALYAHLQGAKMPNISIEEIPALFRERDGRIRGLEGRVMRAIDSGEIQEPIASALREAIEESREPVVEEQSALDRYIMMITEFAAAQEQELQKASGGKGRKAGRVSGRRGRIQGGGDVAEMQSS